MRQGGAVRFRRANRRGTFHRKAKPPRRRNSEAFRFRRPSGACASDARSTAFAQTRALLRSGPFGRWRETQNHSSRSHGKTPRSRGAWHGRGRNTPRGNIPIPAPSALHFSAGCIQTPCFPLSCSAGRPMRFAFFLSVGSVGRHKGTTQAGAAHKDGYPRWAAQGHTPSRRGAQGHNPRWAARKGATQGGRRKSATQGGRHKGAHTAYIISYFLLKYHCFFTKTRRFFAARPAKRKKARPRPRKKARPRPKRTGAPK